MILKCLFWCNTFLFFPSPPPSINSLSHQHLGIQKCFEMKENTSIYVWEITYFWIWLDGEHFSSILSGGCLQNLSLLQFLAYVNFNKDRLSVLKTKILMYFSPMYVNIIHAFPWLDLKFRTLTWNWNIMLLTEIEMKAG